MRHHRLRKMPVWLAGQRANLDRASCIHATAEQEYRFVRELGFRAPVMLLPNGVHVPRDEDCVRETQGRRRLLFLARIHQKKGVDILLRAWKNVEDRFPDWELRVVGPDDGGYLPTMRRLAVQLGTRRAVLTGYVTEDSKPDEFRRAELYILPTHSENWGMSVAEALSYGLPAIVGRGAPWSELVTRDCGWWISNTVDSVTACLETALVLSPSELREKGQRSRTWAQDFRWDRIAARTVEAYRWLIEGGTPPNCVLLD
jgi:glycosyltransferase involved in cell wall biosynthesis